MVKVGSMVGYKTMSYESTHTHTHRYALFLTTLHLSTDTLCYFYSFSYKPLFVFSYNPSLLPSAARQAIGTSSIVPLGWTTIPVIPLITVIKVMVLHGMDRAKERIEEIGETGVSGGVLL